MVEGKTAKELANDIFWYGEESDYLLTNKQIRRIKKRLHKMVDGFTITVRNRIWTVEGGPIWNNL